MLTFRHVIQSVARNQHKSLESIYVYLLAGVMRGSVTESSYFFLQTGRQGGAREARTQFASWRSVPFRQTPVWALGRGGSAAIINKDLAARLTAAVLRAVSAMQIQWSEGMCVGVKLGLSSL